jgi:hypothetical protein
MVGVLRDGRTGERAARRFSCFAVKVEGAMDGLFHLTSSPQHHPTSRYNISEWENFLSWLSQDKHTIMIVIIAVMRRTKRQDRQYNAIKRILSRFTVKAITNSLCQHSLRWALMIRYCSKITLIAMYHLSLAVSWRHSCQRPKLLQLSCPSPEVCPGEQSETPSLVTTEDALEAVTTRHVSDILRQSVRRLFIPLKSVECKFTIAFAALTLLTNRDVGNDGAHSIVLGSFTLEVADKHVPETVELVHFVGLIVFVIGLEERVQSPDVARELVAIRLVEALAELQDSFVDRFLAGGDGNPAVAQEVLFEDGKFVRADLESLKETGLVLLACAQSDGGLLVFFPMAHRWGRSHRGRLDAGMCFCLSNEGRRCRAEKKVRTAFLYAAAPARSMSFHMKANLVRLALSMCMCHVHVSMAEFAHSRVGQ